LHLLADDTVEVKLGLSDDDEYLANGSSLTRVNIVSLGHDSNDLIKPCSSDIDVETTEISKIRRNKSVGMTRGRNLHHSKYAFLE